MKQPPRPPHELDLSGVLKPTDFFNAVNLWESIRTANGADLTNCLLLPGTTGRLPSLSFPVMQIVELVSAVGVQSIRARFVVLRDSGQRPHFSVAMYAAGANDSVLSSYYLAERYWTKPGTPVPHPTQTTRKNSRDTPKHALPTALANYWAANWADVARYPTNADRFTSAGAPLNGYNFAVSDLMDPLRALKDFGNQALAMNFGLHTFLNFTGQADAPVATIGLMLQMTNLSEKDEEGGGGDVFDIAVPSPPGP